jgi:hypothetical protein
MDPGTLNGVTAIWLHSGTREKPGAARHLIYRPGELRGSIILSASDRKDLANGAALLRLYVKGVAGSVADAPLVLR